jgi:peptide subunit release factor 1 (eRF1)
MIDISKEKVELKCPECNSKLRVTIGQVSRQEIVHCQCGKDIQLVDDKGSNKKAIKDVNKSFRDFERTMKKFGK